MGRAVAVTVIKPSKSMTTDTSAAYGTSDQGGTYERKNQMRMRSTTCRNGFHTKMSRANRGSRAGT